MCFFKSSNNANQMRSKRLENCLTVVRILLKEGIVFKLIQILKCYLIFVIWIAFNRAVMESNNNIMWIWQIK